MKKPINAYHATLRRVPDDIILAVATRPIELRESQECVCGWMARETHARRMNVDAAERATRLSVTSALADTYGGSEFDEWCPINWAYGSQIKAENLERAFVERVMEAAGEE